MDIKTRIIGLMSGTSLDGLDICCVDFWRFNKQIQFEIIASRSYDYTKDFQARLKSANQSSEKEIADLDVDFGILMADFVKQFLNDSGLKNTIDFIASHGHTVFHEPSKGITVQVGNGQVLADLNKIQVINDFRIGDVKLGGQGAPLVPIGDKLLFSKYQACLNLGGISNISFDKQGERIAFDIGPANIPLNYLVQEELDMNYDENGDLAKSGQVIPDLLEKLNVLPFYDLSPPKSLGIEWMNENIFPLLRDFKKSRLEDRLATLVEHEVVQVAEILNQENIKEVLITGGGTNNLFWIERLKLLSKAEIVIPSKEIVEFKEALIFALLGYLRVNHETNILSSVTGAVSDSCGGIMHVPSIKSST